MKKVMTIMVLIIATEFAMAHNDGSVLNIRLSNNAPFKISIDGYRVGVISNRAQLRELSEGKHFIEVYEVNNHRGYERRNNVFKGFVDVGCHKESFATVDLSCHKLQFDRIVALDHREGRGRRSDAGFYPNHDRDFPNPFENVAPLGPLPMSQIDFAQLKYTINHGGFESTKLNIFKQALAYNYFTSAQVSEIMNLFWFESSKLEVAKISYSKTVDPHNYYTLNNEFTFSSSVDELGDYVALR
jgi:hypothetical protein